MFCVSLALFGTAFLGFLGYLIQIQMPFLKFKMIDRETTQNALYTSSIIYFVLFLIILLYDCCKTKQYPQYKVYQQWKYEILSIQQTIFIILPKRLHINQEKVINTFVFKLQVSQLNHQGIVIYNKFYYSHLIQLLNLQYMNDYQKQLFIMSDQQQLKQEVLSNEVYKTCFKILPVNASQEEFKKCMGNYIQSYEIIQQAFEQFFKKPKFPQQQQ